MSGRKEPEFVVREHWHSEEGEERKEKLEKLRGLWKEMSRTAASEEKQ